MSEASHALNIEQGGIRAERFAYGWCPCGWNHEEAHPNQWTDDNIKRAFLRHLQSVGGEKG